MYIPCIWYLHKQSENIFSFWVLLNYHVYFLDARNAVVVTTNFEYRLQHPLLYSIRSKQRQCHFVRIVYFCAVFDFRPFISQKTYLLYIHTQWCISQTQQNFIMFIIVLGQHVSILIESSSGPSKIQILT